MRLAKVSRRLYLLKLICSLSFPLSCFKLTHNGSGLADVADLKALNCQAAPKIINSTHFQFALHPQYSASPCYRQFAVQSKHCQFNYSHLICVSDFMFLSSKIIFAYTNKPVIINLPKFYATYTNLFPRAGWSGVSSC